MRISKKRMMIMALSLMLMVSSSGFVFGAVTAEEAAQLGKTLTLFGAEKDGNADGTIPPYTGGLTTPPASYKLGSGRYTDPFPEEKPLFSIHAQNMNQYADRLTEGTKAVMKKWPDYRIDVYKTHRTVAYPEYILKNTAEKCALHAKTAQGGLSLEGARACIAFPIPKTGHEVMWNHLTSYKGLAFKMKYIDYIRDRSGRLTLVDSGEGIDEFPFYDENPSAFDKPYYKKEFGRSTDEAPARLIGGGGMTFEPLDSGRRSRLSYFYMPGQRRVRLAPEAEFDTPIAATDGSRCNDEDLVFNGSLEKYDWKLVGKREMYIPYSNYKAEFWVPIDQLMGPHYANPDHIRWELHRVWVVEATLKKGHRHIYPQKRFYIDEDNWRAHAAESYNAQGTLVKAAYIVFIQAYDAMAQFSSSMWDSHLVSGISFLGRAGLKGWVKYVEPQPAQFWASETMVGGSVR
jgi:hypothetical protein